MLIKRRRSWELPESAATPESVYMNRREWLKGAGFAGLGLATSGLIGGGMPAPRWPPSAGIRSRATRPTRSTAR